MSAQCRSDRCVATLAQNKRLGQLPAITKRLVDELKKQHRKNIDLKEKLQAGDPHSRRVIGELQSQREKYFVRVQQKQSATEIKHNEETKIMRADADAKDVEIKNQKVEAERLKVEAGAMVVAMESQKTESRKQLAKVVFELKQQQSAKLAACERLERKKTARQQEQAKGDLDAANELTTREQENVSNLEQKLEQTQASHSVERDQIEKKLAQCVVTIDSLHQELEDAQQSMEDQEEMKRQNDELRIFLQKQKEETERLDDQLVQQGRVGEEEEKNEEPLNDGSELRTLRRQLKRVCFYLLVCWCVYLCYFCRHIRRLRLRIIETKWPKMRFWQGSRMARRKQRNSRKRSDSMRVKIEKEKSSMDIGRLTQSQKNSNFHTRVVWLRLFAKFGIIFKNLSSSATLIKPG